MTLIKITLPIAVLASGCAVAAWIAMSAQPEIQEPLPQKIKQVSVQQAVFEKHRFTIESQGFVMPHKQTELSAEVAGRILKTADAFYVGEFITAGTPLIEIDAADYHAQLKMKEAQVASQQLKVIQEEARGNQARREWESTRSDPASELTLRIPHMREAKANLAAAEAEVLMAKRNVERTQVRASFDALIHAKHVEVGQYVAPGTLLATLYVVDYAEVRLPIVNGDIQFLNLPGPAFAESSNALTTVQLSGDFGGQIRQWTANIVRTENTIDEGSRTFYIVARISDPYGWLKQTEDERPIPIGLFVEAEIESRPLPPLVKVPRSALRRTNQLMLVNQESRLVLREVNVLHADREYAYIDGGLEGGEYICLTSPQSLLEGTQVEMLAYLAKIYGRKE